MAKSTCSQSSSSSSCSSATSPSTGSGSGSPARYAARIATAVDRRKRLAANARERKRMHLLNNAYDRLRQRLVDAENKSKYDILVQAKEYIQALASICDQFDRQQKLRNEQRQAEMLPASSSPASSPQQSLSPLSLEDQSSPINMSTAFNTPQYVTSPAYGDYQPAAGYGEPGQPDYATFRVKRLTRELHICPDRSH